MRLLLLTIAVLSFSAQIQSQSSGKYYNEPKNGRFEKTINSQWIFNFVPENDTTDYSSVSVADSGWQAISIPHTWSTFETTGDVHPFIKSPSEKDDPYWWYGVGWYKKKFIISGNQKQKNISLEFDGVMKNCRVFLNGRQIGAHLGGFTSFYLDITKLVRFNKENVLVVAVSNQRNDKFRVPPMTAGNWDLYGGIYRDVRLVIKDRLHIPFQGSHLHEGGTFITTPVVSEKEAVVSIRTFVKNTYQEAVKCKVVSVITTPENRILQILEKTETIQPNQLNCVGQLSSPVNNPELWSPENPQLYHVYTEIYVNGKLSDNYKSPLGFRYFSWDHSKKTIDFKR